MTNKEPVGLETVSEERLRELLSRVSPPAEGWRVGLPTVEVHSIISELLARRLAIQAPDGWQGIESAPKDGTRIWAAEVTDEYTNAMEARWCTPYGPNDETPPKLGTLMTGWWGLSWRLGDTTWPHKDGDLKEHCPWGRANLTALHPTHWCHLPSALGTTDAGDKPDRCDGQLCYYRGCQHLDGCVHRLPAAPNLGATK